MKPWGSQKEEESEGLFHQNEKSEKTSKANPSNPNKKEISAKQNSLPKGGLVKPAKGGTSRRLRDPKGDRKARTDGTGPSSFDDERRETVKGKNP